MIKTLIIIVAVILMCGHALAAEEPEVSMRSLSPDIYGRQDPFAPITYKSAKPSVKEKPGLEGIIWDEFQPLAIINGLIVSEGEMLNGRKVLKIEKQKVILEENGRKITLEL